MSKETNITIINQTVIVVKSRELHDFVSLNEKYIYSYNAEFRRQFTVLSKLQSVLTVHEKLQIDNWNYHEWH